jgi:hypothetical protein
LRLACALVSGIATAAPASFHIDVPGQWLQMTFGKDRDASLKPGWLHKAGQVAIRTGTIGMTRVAISQPDVTLVLDWDGVIRDASVSSSIAKDGLQGWVGRHWTDTVGDVAGDQVRRMVEDVDQLRQRLQEAGERSVVDFVDQFDRMALGFREMTTKHVDEVAIKDTLNQAAEAAGFSPNPKAA